MRNDLIRLWRQSYPYEVLPYDNMLSARRHLAWGGIALLLCIYGLGLLLFAAFSLIERAFLRVIMT